MWRLLQFGSRWLSVVRWKVLTGGIGLLVLVAVLLAVIVYLPQLVIDPRGLTRDQWLTHIQDLRTSILQGLGGLAVLAGAVTAGLNLRETSRQNRAVLELQRRGQTTERFTKAVEQLGQQGLEKLDMRIGAIYALEQIARDSAELHWPIVEVLTGYLRVHAAVPVGADAEAEASPPKRLPADHQVIATVIGRRRREQDPQGNRLDLRGTDLLGVRWHGAHLEEAMLDGAHLEEAMLDEAHLERAHIHHANLERACLHRAHLEGASLEGAHLKHAVLVNAHLEGASLANASLEDARLNGAHLEQAELTGALLKMASLGAVSGLTPDQFECAVGWQEAIIDRKLSWAMYEHRSALRAQTTIRSSSASSEAGPAGSGGADPDRR